MQELVQPEVDLKGQFNKDHAVPPGRGAAATLAEGIV